MASFQETETQCCVDPQLLIFDFDVASKFSEKKLAKKEIIRIDETQLSTVRWKQSIAEWINSKEFLMGRGIDGENIIYHRSLAIQPNKLLIGLNLKNENSLVAIKLATTICDFEGDEDVVYANLKKEVDTYQELRNIPGIVKYVASWSEEIENDTPEVKTFVVLEGVEGSLENLLLNSRWYSADSDDQVNAVQHVLRSILTTLKMLVNGPKVWIHCDVQPANIMIDANKNVLLGSLKEWDIASFKTTTGGSYSLRFVAPELVNGFPASKTSDLYSLGLTFRKMISKEEWTLSYNLPPLSMPAGWPTYRQFAAQHLLESLLQQKPEHRGFSEWATEQYVAHDLLLMHPFFWPVRHSIDFLVALQSIYPHLPKLREAISSALSEDGLTRNWFMQLPESFRSELNLSTQKQSDPIELVEFIYFHESHMQDPDYPCHLREQLHTGQLFLSTFPRLVCCCWFALIKEISASCMFPSLQRFFCVTKLDERVVA
jgi:serine/threonine protein kinase